MLERQRVKIAIIALSLVGLGLFGCQKQAAAAPAHSRASQAASSPVKHQAAGSSKQSSQKPKVTAAKKPSTPKQKPKAQVPEQVSGTAKPLDSKSNAALVAVIAKAMQNIQRGPHAPVRWTVAVKSLDGKFQANVSDWTPAEAQFSASTIKLYVLIRYYQCLQAGILHASDRYTLQKSDVVEGSGVMLKAPLGTQYTLSQLETLMIEKSDNIATNVLIRKVGGFSAVNRTIASIVGPNHHTSLERLMMDTSNIGNGRANRINAMETVDTLLKLYRGQIISPKVDAAMRQPMLKTANRTKLPSQLPAGAVCYNKSGESNYRGIENDMALIRYQGHVFAICALVEMNGNNEAPDDATIPQTQSEVQAIANLGQAVTLWAADQY